jgi:hypothetical protein
MTSISLEDLQKVLREYKKTADDVDVQSQPVM